MQRNPVLITTRVSTRADLYHALSDSAFGCGRPAPTNLDALADLVRECGITRVVCAQWGLSEKDTERIQRVFADLGVTLTR